MTWGGANRPVTSNRLGGPNPDEGTDGDMQVRQTNLGGKLFGKLGGRWYDVPLSIDGVTRFGTSLSDHLSIDRDSVDITKDSNKVASFGSTITLGQTTNEHIRLTSSSMQMKDGSSVMMSLADGSISMGGKIILTSAATRNICIGVNNTDVGEDNISIGVNAGAALTTDNKQNILIGSYAGKTMAHNSSDYNICIGFESGQIINGTGSTEGGYNICLGQQAGYSATRNQGCTYIGFRSNSSSVTADNEVVIIGRANAYALMAGNGSNTVTLGSDTTTEVYLGDSAGADLNCDNIDYSGTLTSSDLRMKKNIKDFSLGLEFINELRPVSFNMKLPDEYDDEFKEKIEWHRKDQEILSPDDKTTRIGFIAQEVKSALGDTISDLHKYKKKDAEGGRQGLDYVKFVIPLTKAVQELSAKIDTMQTEINNLK